jgi:hypothetical protein
MSLYLDLYLYVVVVIIGLSAMHTLDKETATGREVVPNKKRTIVMFVVALLIPVLFPFLAVFTVAQGRKEGEDA